MKTSCILIVSAIESNSMKRMNFLSKNRGKRCRACKDSENNSKCCDGGNVLQSVDALMGYASQGNMGITQFLQ